MSCENCGADTIHGVTLFPPCVIANSFSTTAEIPFIQQKESFDHDYPVQNNHIGEIDTEHTQDDVNLEVPENCENAIEEDNPSIITITNNFFGSLTPEQIQLFKYILNHYEAQSTIVESSSDDGVGGLVSATNVLSTEHSNSSSKNFISPRINNSPSIVSETVSTKLTRPSSLYRKGANRVFQSFEKIRESGKATLLISLGLLSILLLSTVGYILLGEGFIPADSDGDGVRDSDDAFPNDPLYSSDSDGDGLADEYEWNIGTDSNSNDTDLDGLADGMEVERGLNPLSGDSDDDGYSDSEDLYPLSNWVATVDFSGYETETNQVCESAGSNQMTWRLATSSPINEWVATGTGSGGGSGNYILDLPDDKSEVSVTFVVDATYTNCILSNEEQLFWGVFGWQYTHTASDPGGDSELSAVFTYVLTPGSSHGDTSIGSRTSDDWRDAGWLSRATISVQA